MKSVIVIYVPLRTTQEEKNFLDENLKKLKECDLHAWYHFVYIEDPAREKVEIEIFFNPYQL